MRHIRKSNANQVHGIATNDCTNQNRKFACDMAAASIAMPQ
jgi:hypothetical protein